MKCVVHERHSHHHLCNHSEGAEYIDHSNIGASDYKGGTEYVDDNNVGQVTETTRALEQSRQR